MLLVLPQVGIDFVAIMADYERKANKK